MYGLEVTVPSKLMINPFFKEEAISIRAVIYWLLTSELKEISPPSSVLPLISKGGYPDLFEYLMSAPKSFNASTKIFIGLFCILFDPVI